MTFTCQFCKNEFKNQSNLNNHLRIAKYCLKLRNENSQNICQYCKKDLSNKRNLNLHEEKCKYSEPYFLIIQKQSQEKDIQIEILQKELIEKNQIIQVKDQIIQDKNQTIDKLQNQIHEIALKASLKTNNTNNTTNNIVNLPPLTKEWLDSQAINFNNKYFQNGIHGYAEFAANYSLKDRVKCTDLARNIFHYIDEEGKKIKDKGHNLSKMFFSSIKEKNTELFHKQKDHLFSLLETANQTETEELFKLINLYKDNTIGIDNIIKGEPDKFRDNFIKELSTRLAKIKS